MRKRPRQARPVLTNPIAFVMQGLKVADKGTTDTITIRMNLAYGALRTGSLAKADWDAMADSLNHAQTLALHVGVGKEYAADILRARGVWLELGDRLVRDGRVTARADELNAMRDFVEIHEAQLRNATGFEIEKAARRVKELRRSAPVFSPSKEGHA